MTILKAIAMAQKQFKKRKAKEEKMKGIKTEK